MHHQAYDSIVDAIGHTPLVKLNRITEGLSSEIFAKLEFMNPMGSVKDRIARYMIEKAERDGRIHEGQLIVENSSGNTALGLALIARQKGYRLKVVVRDSLSPEKVHQLKALDVDIQMVDHTLPPESPDSYNNLAARLARELPDCFFPDQHNNRDNNEAHYRTTGPEIWEQMGGRIDYVVAGIGTGGTLCGAGRFLKEQDARIQIIALDPVGSVFYPYFREGKRVPPAPYRIEGLGDEFLVGCVDFESAGRGGPGDRPRRLSPRPAAGRGRGHPGGRLQRRGHLGRARSGPEAATTGPHRDPLSGQRFPVPEHHLQQRVDAPERVPVVRSQNPAIHNRSSSGRSKALIPGTPFRTKRDCLKKTGARTRESSWCGHVRRPDSPVVGRATVNHHPKARGTHEHGKGC